MRKRLDRPFVHPIQTLNFQKPSRFDNVQKAISSPKSPCTCPQIHRALLSGTFILNAMVECLQITLLSFIFVR